MACQDIIMGCLYSPKLDTKGIDLKLNREAEFRYATCAASLGQNFLPNFSSSCDRWKTEKKVGYYPVIVDKEHAAPAHSLQSLLMSAEWVFSISAAKAAAAGAMPEHATVKHSISLFSRPKTITAMSKTRV
jgi:hypothetical protein